MKGLERYKDVTIDGGLDITNENGETIGVCMVGLDRVLINTQAPGIFTF